MRGHSRGNVYAFRDVPPGCFTVTIRLVRVKSMLLPHATSNLGRGPRPATWGVRSNHSRRFVAARGMYSAHLPLFSWHKYCNRHDGAGEAVISHGVNMLSLSAKAKPYPAPFCVCLRVLPEHLSVILWVSTSGSHSSILW